MLKSIDLENFKAFGERTMIPLAPITLIYGENSSGKSSILQSLNLLKQTRDNRDADALLLPRSEKGLNDFGSFREMLFDHDEERTMRFRLDVENDESNTPKRARNFKIFGLEFAFSRKSAKEEITMEEIRLFDGMEEDALATFAKSDIPEFVRNQIRYPFRSGSSSRAIHGLKCTNVNPNSNHWDTVVKQLLSNKEQLLKVLKEWISARKFVPSLQSTPERLSATDFQYDNSEQTMVYHLEKAVSLLTNSDGQESIRNWIAEQQVGHYLFLDGFIPYQSEYSQEQVKLIWLINQLGFKESHSGGITELDTAAVSAGRHIDQVLANLFPLGPFRKPPERWYVFSGTTPRDVGFGGQSLPDLLFRQDDVLAETNDWLERLRIGYRITARSLGGPGSDLFELRLLDTRRSGSVEVGLSDVGFGISQILPLVVQSLVAKNQIITVEQPEVHIHPRLQADLGDLLIEAIEEPRGNQFIIETHSEHLALRLQRRVREKKIAPDAICILYVCRRENGACVLPLKLNEEGDFTEEFPGGFFPERLEELR